MARQCMEMGAKVLLLKCGAPGMYLCTANEETLSGIRSLAFLQAVLEGEGPTMAMHLAAAEGASCVEAYDALGGLKSLDELKRKIEAGWEKREA